ncbi:hypothetical protein MGSAQ_001152, partial [marine sediment metagenome]
DTPITVLLVTQGKLFKFIPKSTSTE